MENYFDKVPASWYEIPKNVSPVLVNPITGMVANKDDQNKKILYYLKGTEPMFIKEVNSEKKEKE